MAHNPFDKAARYVARLDPPAFLSWLLRLPPDAFAFDGWLDTRSVTLPPGAERIGDTVAALRDLARHGVPWALPVEFQIQPDAEQFGRLLVYGAAIWLQQRPSPERGDRYEIGLAVVNLTGRGRASRECRWPEAGLRTAVEVVERNLATESAADLLRAIAAKTTGRCLLPFVPLMHGGDQAGIMAEWKRLAAPEPDAQKRGAYGALARIFAEAADRGEQWQEALKGWDVMESKVVAEWQAEALKRGREEGRKEGERSAAVKTARKSVLDFLSARFGDLPADLKRKLAALKTAEKLSPLAALAGRALDLAEFRRLAQL